MLSILLNCFFFPTVIKANGTRCTHKFCYPTLQRLYKQDAEQIVKAGRNILGVDVKEHVGPDVANYLWKVSRPALWQDLSTDMMFAPILTQCPVCRSSCQCSMCRKKLGLEPLGNLGPYSRKAAGSSAIASKPKRMADGDADESRKTKKAALAPQVAVSQKTEPSSRQSSAFTSSSSAISQFPPLNVSEQAGPSNLLRPKPQDPSKEAGPNSPAPQPLFTTPPRDLGPLAPLSPAPLLAPTTVSAPAPSKSKAPLQQQTFQKLLRKPKPVDKPRLTRMETRLPLPNIMARVWLYESLVRFDCFKIPKTVLYHLDKFDDWTEVQLQTILERLICSLADISAIKTTPLRSIHRKMVEAFRYSGENFDRGEAWEAARDYCLLKEVVLLELENTEPLPHQKGRDRKMKDGRWNTEETLLNRRQTRSQRLAEMQMLKRVKTTSKRGLESSSDESDESEDSTVETSVEEESEDEVPKGPRRSKRGLRKSARQKAIAMKRASISEDEQDDSSSANEEEESVKRERSESLVEVVQEEKSRGPVPAPPFEQRVAVLCGLVDVLVQSKQVNQEITSGFKHALALDKSGKEEEKELIRKHNEEMTEVERRAPSMTMVEEFWQWKEDRLKLIKEHEVAMRNARVQTHLLMEAHKSRCEPLGLDSDGNEYWHLSEYIETKPEDTSGRWAWSLLVLGTTFGAETQKEERQSSMALQPIEVDSARVSGNVTPKDDKKTPVDDGIVVLINVPLKKSHKEGQGRKEDIKTPEVQPRASMPVQIEAVVKEPQRTFSGASDCQTVARLSAYIQHRLLMCEFEELQEYRGKNQAEEAKAKEAAEQLQVQATKMTSSISATAQDANVQGRMLLASGERGCDPEKADLKERHKARRTQVEALLKRLEIVREYYEWHEEDEASD